MRQTKTWVGTVHKVAVTVSTPDSSDLVARPKVASNRLKALSQRKFGNTRKPQKKLACARSTTDESVPVTLFTPDVQSVLFHLLTPLRERGVLKQSIKLHGPTARAVAAAFHKELQEHAGIDDKQLCSLYGCTKRELSTISDRLSATGGAVAVLAHVALHAGGDEAAKCAGALQAIARGIMRTRASGLGTGGEDGSTSIRGAQRQAVCLAPHPLPAEVVALSSGWDAPPPATLAAELCPGGADYCGGDFVCIDLTMVNRAFLG
jgi:hypothetical protein